MRPRVGPPARPRLFPAPPPRPWPVPTTEFHRRSSASAHIPTQPAPGVCPGPRAHTSNPMQDETPTSDVPAEPTDVLEPQAEATEAETAAEAAEAAADAAADAEEASELSATVAAMG